MYGDSLEILLALVLFKIIRNYSMKMVVFVGLLFKVKFSNCYCLVFFNVSDLIQNHN